MTSPLMTVLSHLPLHEKEGQSYKAVCPVPEHIDNSPSLQVSLGEDGRVLLHCFAGCSFEKIINALGLSPKDLFPTQKQHKGKPITLKSLAKDKKLPVSFLKKLGLEHRIDGVYIPYRKANGMNAPRSRIRKALKAKDGSIWSGKKGGSIIPYGLERLSDAREQGYLVLVEGESDCWTLWFHGFPALGIPGTGMTGKVELSHLDGISRIYAWREPDTGGTSFQQQIRERLKKIGYAGQVLELAIPNIKDPSDLHIQDPDSFKNTFQDALEKALIHGGAGSLAGVNLAEEFMTARKKRIVFWRGGYSQYTGTHYESLPNNDLQAEVIRYLQDSKNPHLAGKRCAANIIANIEGKCLFPSRVDPPAELSTPGPRSLNAELIPLQNGVLDIGAYLRGEKSPILPHDPKYFWLHSLPYAFDPKATAPTWDKLLKHALPDMEYRQLVMEWFGYNLLPDTSLEHFVLFYGEAGTGKSVTCTVLCALLGNTAVSSVPLEAFSAIRTFPLAATVGKLANISGEIGDCDKIAEGILKDFVSGQPITVEQKFRDPFSFRPTARLTFATNKLPRITDRSDGVWRRMIPIEFKNKVPEVQRDGKYLKLSFWEKSGELPGVFNMALRGLASLRRRGRFQLPAGVADARRNYKQDSNPTSIFLEENVVADLRGKVSSTQVYRKYRDWMQERGYHSLSEGNFAVEIKRQFSRAEKEKNATRQPDGKRERSWRGIRLLTR